MFQPKVSPNISVFNEITSYFESVLPHFVREVTDWYYMRYMQTCVYLWGNINTIVCEEELEYLKDCYKEFWGNISGGKDKYWYFDGWEHFVDEITEVSNDPKKHKLELNKLK